MNTPDTEKKCCEKCECHAGIPPAKRMSQLHGTPFCGYTNCPCHTPDTEKLQKISVPLPLNAVELLVERVNQIIDLLSSRDTYWKERVEEAVKAERERILKACDVNSFLRDEDHEDFVVYLTDIETITKATPITNEDKTNGL